MKLFGQLQCYDIGLDTVLIYIMLLLTFDNIMSYYILHNLMIAYIAYNMLDIYIMTFHLAHIVGIYCIICDMHISYITVKY